VTSFGELLAASQEGDQFAFSAIFRSTQPALLRYLRVLAGHAAEDVAAETWVDVAKGLGRFDGDEGAFRGWVFTMARHRLFDWRRSLSRRPADPVPTESMAGLRGSDGDDPALAAERSMSTADALRLVACLPPDQAEVVLLRAVAGLDVEQVAKITGKSVGNVRVLAHRGLRKLAERLSTPAHTEV
jgi:RNA polymerase sigma-70 factor (ECF subfamily)